MLVRDVMTSDCECIDPTDTVQQAAQRMRDLDVGTLPVCENGRLAGMLTDRDIAIRVVAEGDDPSRCLVLDRMTPGIAYCFDDQEVDEAARTMSERQIRRLPVLNRDKQLVGILSLGDLALECEGAPAGETLRNICERAGA